MSGLLRRLTRRRPATADENRSPATASSEPVAAPAETPAEPGGQPPVPEEQPTVVLPATAEQPAAPAQPLPAWTVAAGQTTAFAYAAQPAPARDLPAGVDPADLAAAPAASSRRGKLRRRLRYLRHVRELLLRDLGGFTYEIHRTAGGTVQEPQRNLAAAKAKRISALDAEVRALESRLGEPHETLLREPGIGGTCPECGELHASDAHYCSRCGTALDARARAQRAAEQPAPAAVEPQPTTGSHAVAEPQPASVLWAGGPRPAPEPERTEEEDTPQPPSAVTSQWLATDRPTTFSRAAQPEAPAKADEPAPVTPDEPTPPTADESAPAKPDEPTPPTADEPAPAKPDEPTPPTADEPAASTTPAEPDDAAPPAPATAAARAKPKRAAKPRKPAAKRAPAKPRAATAKPAADKAPQQEADEPKPTYVANGRRDEDVPPPLSSGDPLAAPRDQRP